MVKTERQIKYDRLSILILALVAVALLFLLTVDTGRAEIDVYGIAYNNTIVWNWSEENVLNIAIDGKMVENFDNNSLSYQQTFDKDIYPTAHRIIVYSIDDNGYNITMTIIPSDGWNNIGKMIWLYLFLFFALITLVVSFWTKEGFISVIAFIFSLIGYGLTINQSFEFGIVYMVMMMVSIGLAFQD